jgi:hypothetical protein
MPRFDDLADTLARQRRDLEKGLDDTAVSQVETGSILAKIEELRRRSKETTERSAPSPRRRADDDGR